MKDIGNYKLSKIRDALGRLDAAVGRLESAAQNASAQGLPDEALKAELATLMENHAALKKTAGHVAARLDATIERLTAQLKT